MTRLLATFLLGLTACGAPQTGNGVSGEPAPVGSAPQEPSGDAVRECEERKAEAQVPLRIVADLTELEEQLTPPLPLSWPPTDDRVVYYEYTSRALPTGDVVYEISEPHARIVLSTVSQEHVEEPMAAEPAVLGPFREPPDNPLADDSVEPAMQALLDVASRRRCAEDAHAEIRGYCSWFELQHPMARWVEARHGDFVSWLSCDPD